MSDYTATSRNAFIALKKEAIHDLAWRLSYLELQKHIGDHSFTHTWELVAEKLRSNL